MGKPKKINIDIKERVKNYEEKLRSLQEELQVEPVITLEFPQYKILPDDLTLALKIIEKHERKFMLTYKDLKNGH